MARKPGEDLDYAENRTGTFTSQAPGSAADVEGDNVKVGDAQGNSVNYARKGFPAPAAPQAAPARATSLYPGAQPKLLGRGLVPDASDAQGNLTAARQSVGQMQAQNDFDRRMGFKPTHSDDDITRIANMVNPAKPASITPGVKSQLASPSGAPVSPTQAVGTPSKSPLDALNPPTIDGNITPQTGNALLGVPGQDIPPATPNAFATGNAPRIPGYSGGNPAAASQPPDVAKLGSGFFGAIKRGAGNVLTALNRPVTSSQNPLAARAPNGAGDAIASGVSNATAAQFQKPTKANPLPVTPTTPTDNIDKSEESLGRFGYSDDEFNKRKLAFAGFR